MRINNGNNGLGIHQNVNAVSDNKRENCAAPNKKLFGSMVCHKKNPGNNAISLS